MDRGAQTEDTGPAAPARRLRRRLARVLVGLALSAASLCLALLALELVLARLEAGGRGPDTWRSGGGYHRPDRELIYSPEPGATHVFRTGEFTERVRINSLGLRDDELPDRSQVDFRIVVVGDSMTFGHGVQADEAFPNVLEALYRERGGRRVDVVNAAVKGYGSDQYHALFQKRLRALGPDLLIVAFYQNDLHDNVLHPLYALADERLVELDPTADELYRIGRLKSFLPRAVRDTRVARWAVRRVAGSADRPPEGRELDERLGIERRKLALQVRDLAETGRREGFEVLVLGVPHRGGPPTLYSWLGAVTEGRARLLDLNADESWQRERGRLFFPVDFHLNAAGHERIAAELFAYLEREGL